MNDADASRSSTQRRRAVLASTVGTTIEWYDFFLYGTVAALVFPKLFFPGVSAEAGVLESFSTLFIGFAARPIGAAIFGHYGDRIGRKATLITTLMLMGVATALIGVLPGYQTLGFAAPVLLTVLRIVQGIGVGGEWGGSVLMSMEWGSVRRRGLMASFPQMGVPIGLVLSTGAVQFFSATTGADFERWGWRVPFLLSVVLIAIGLYVRLRVLESPEFRAVQQRQQVAHRPVWQVIKQQPREILAAAFIRMSEQAPFYLFVTFVLTYGTKQLHLPRGQVLTDTLIAAAIGLVSVPLFGYVSDLIGRRTMYAIGAVLTGLYALAFGTQVRYSGAGLGYQLASVVAGGPAPLIAAALLARFGTSTPISWYIVGCAMITLLALLAMPAPAPVSTPSSTGRPVQAGA
jgi:MFS family permease